MLKLSMSKLSLFKQAPGVLLGANGQPGSMAIGNTLMLLMKPPAAQGGCALSFPHPGHYLGIPSACFRLAPDQKHVLLSGSTANAGW